MILKKRPTEPEELSIAGLLLVLSAVLMRIFLLMLQVVALNAFKGAVLAISHNHEFASQVCR